MYKKSSVWCKVWDMRSSEVRPNASVLTQDLRLQGGTKEEIEEIRGKNGFWVGPG